MKKFIFLFGILAITSSISAQNVLTENFDNLSWLIPNGWIIHNSSEPLGSSSWGSPNNHFPPYNGGNSSFIAVNHQSTGNIGTISNWLITPTVLLNNGDIISFYTRTDHGIYPDRLELRISTNGDATILPTSSSSSLGDFSTLVLTVNPNLIASEYPTTWTNYSYTISGLSQATNCKVAFRYYVTNAGANAPNSDFIGIDAVTISSSTLSNPNFQPDEVSLYPNPSTDLVTINTDKDIKKIECFDLLGRKTNIPLHQNKTISLSNLKKGHYILKITIDDNAITKSIVKN
ncbi:conserved exported hypothetical protein [Flavobacterium sp. 9AF]|uniref:T9SS-dependent choice-of-anchor J family protein n=1 Tax=Flavobacterium sp. 9AF TaxID=2653142 RepID=UPI0012EF78DA|nr:choice-of-anchor J domain-containing protein [Flavobacterium sp. 9AF]VXB25961.1 conserved exported hypothetical protein [Flavobacterium sp. 9AF]